MCSFSLEVFVKQIYNCLIFESCEVQDMNKGGRPKLDETKETIVGVRLSNEEAVRLKAYASLHKVTLTQVVREALDMFFRENEK